MRLKIAVDASSLVVRRRRLMHSVLIETMKLSGGVAVGIAAAAQARHDAALSHSSFPEARLRSWVDCTDRYNTEYGLVSIGR